MARPKKGQQTTRSVRLTNDIGEYEGRPVTGTSVRLTGSGDGLSEPLVVAGRTFQLDEEVTFIVRGKVRAVNHKHAAKEGEDLVRVHTIPVEDLVYVEDNVGSKLIAAQREAVLRAKEKVLGVQRLDDALPEDETPEVQPRPKRAPRKPRGGLAAVPDVAETPTEDPF